MVSDNEKNSKHTGILPVSLFCSAVWYLLAGPRKNLYSLETPVYLGWSLLGDLLSSRRYCKMWAIRGPLFKTRTPPDILWVMDIRKQYCELIFGNISSWTELQRQCCIVNVFWWKKAFHTSAVYRQDPPEECLFAYTLLWIRLSSDVLCWKSATWGYEKKDAAVHLSISQITPTIHKKH